jgi:[acyl-carrier-protein] S-malonyltransferase
MGQYTAFVAVGCLSLADALRLVRERGRLMQASGLGPRGPDGGPDRARRRRLPELVAGASTHGVFGVANRNAPGQVVVSGERAAVEAGDGAGQDAGRPAGDRAAGQRRGPLAADGRGRRPGCAAVLSG